jgi:LysM repeat protein
VRYSARPADTLATVADVVFAGLASADQIRSANGLAEEDPDALLDAGETLVIPFPCVCFNSTDNNLPAVYLSYVVRVGDTVESIAGSHATTVTDLSNVNAMGSPIVAPGDILAIPLPGKIISPYLIVAREPDNINTIHINFLPILLQNRLHLLLCFVL